MLVPECKVVTLIRILKTDDEIVDHYAVKCPDGGLLDADGYESNETIFVQKFVKNEYLGSDLWKIKSIIIEPRLIKGDAPDNRLVAIALSKGLKNFLQ
jgi:hypothetical protein